MGAERAWAQCAAGASFDPGLGGHTPAEGGLHHSVAALSKWPSYAEFRGLKRLLQKKKKKKKKKGEPLDLTLAPRFYEVQPRGSGGDNLSDLSFAQQP